MKSLSVLFCFFVFCIMFNANIHAQNDTTQQPSKSNSSQPADINPEVVKTVEPIYPESELQKKIDLTVYLKVLLSGEGKILKVVPVDRGFKNLSDTSEVHADSSLSADEYDKFVDSAVKAAKLWLFSPGKKDGEPIRVWMMVPVHFRLKD